jgi:hypothetical protein
MESENVQYGGGKQLSVFTMLVYLLGMVAAGYGAWVYCGTKFDNTKKYIIVSVAVAVGFVLVYLLRSLTFNL